MSRISGVGADSSTASRRETDLGSVDLDQFLQLLITELQNQDPMDPLDNAQLVQQLGQIREIGATNLLTETLNTVLDGQNLTTASSMIGKRVVALSDNGEQVEGLVQQVSIEPSEKDDQQRQLRVMVGEQSVQLRNIREIIGGGSDDQSTQ